MVHEEMCLRCHHINSNGKGSLIIVALVMKQFPLLEVEGKGPLCSFKKDVMKKQDAYILVETIEITVTSPSSFKYYDLKAINILHTLVIGHPRMNKFGDFSNIGML